jgi:hypothetical protein
VAVDDQRVEGRSSELSSGDALQRGARGVGQERRDAADREPRSTRTGRAPRRAPTLRAFVLEGAKHRPLRGRPTGGHEDTAGVPSPLATRPAAGKVAGRYLAPRLEERLRVVASP